MKIRVHRVYDIDTDLDPRAFIRALNAYNQREVGEPLETQSLHEAVITATYACDAGDLTEMVTDNGNAVVYIECEDPDLVLTWKDAWADGETWP